MKKTIFLLAALFMMTNCASDTSENSNGRNLLVSLVPSTTDVLVDHTFTIIVNAEEEIKKCGFLPTILQRGVMLFAILKLVLF